MDGGQLVLAGVSAIIGGAIGLGGTLLTLREQRKLATDTWRRDRLGQAVAEVLAATNFFTRSVEGDSWAYDARWVEYANAMDRLSMVASDPGVHAAAKSLNDYMRRLHSWRNEKRDLPVGSAELAEWWDLLHPLWKHMGDLVSATGSVLAMERP